MALERRGKKGIFWTYFTPPGGRRVRKSTGTTNKTEAQEFEDALKTKYWRFYQLDEKPPLLWKEAVVRWIKEKERNGKKTLEENLRVLRWLDAYLRDIPVNRIDETVIEDIVEKRIAAGNLQRRCPNEPETFKPISNATLNRLLEVIRSILRNCVEWKVLDKCPSIKLLKEDNERIRWITEEEAQKLLKELPPHQAAITEFALETGLRESNITGLKWVQINLDKKRLWKSTEEMKNKEALGIPLSKRAVEILKEQLEKHSVYVFTFEGRPVKKAHTAAWDKAKERASITNFKWHDMRHTWASWHIQRGTPLHVLKELGGWKTLAMPLRYAHLNADHLAEYVEKNDTKMTQNKREGKE